MGWCWFDDYASCNPGASFPKAPDGEVRIEDIAKGLPGSDGSTIVTAFDSFAAMGIAPPINWLAEYLHDTEIDFVNQDLEICVAKLGWLTQLIALAERSHISEFDASTLIPFKRKIAAITNNIGLGADAFGRGRNYIPLTSYQFLMDNVQILVKHANHIEAEFRLLQQVDKNQEESRSKVKQALEYMDVTIVQREKIVDSSIKEINSLQARSDELLAQLDKTWIELNKTSHEFKEALSRQSGCDFGHVVQFGMMIATVAATGGSALTVAGSLKSAIDGINQLNKEPVGSGEWIEQMNTDLKQLGKLVEPAGKSIKEFQSQYTKVKKQIDETFGQGASEELGPGRPSSDYIKLVANKEDFDREIKPFLDMPEARAYKQLMDLFVSTAETRNNVILEHDEKLSHVYNLWASNLATRAEVAALGGKLEFDFELKEVVSFIDRSLQRIKWDLIYFVTSLAKALEYMSAQRINVVINDKNIASIESSLAYIHSEYLRMKERFGSAQQESRGIEIQLKNLLTEQQKAALIAGDTAMFSLRPNVQDDPFGYLYAVSTLRLSISQVPELQSLNFTFRIKHLGRSIVRDKKGRQYVYSHQPVITMVKRSKNGTKIRDGKLNEQSSSYVGVSPYGPWKIRLEEILDKKDREKFVDSVFLNFDVLAYDGDFN